MKQIDQEPDKNDTSHLPFGMSGASFISLLAMAIGIRLATDKPQPFYFGDGVAIVIIGLMLVWFWHPRRKTDAHEDARNSKAFRFGKSLKRVWRGLGSRT